MVRVLIQRQYFESNANKIAPVHTKPVNSPGQTVILSWPFRIDSCAKKSRDILFKTTRLANRGAQKALSNCSVYIYGNCCELYT